jgi:aryl-alcohol dehydrogenase-like predicted oxidoreductase
MRIGLGLAAVGRPGYINLGRSRDLDDLSVAGLCARTWELLDAAYAAGVRYVDVARSYGRAEEFLASWLDARPEATDVVAGSKWGYTYTAGWRTDADVHEVKDHSVATFDRQLAETRAVLGDRLNLYQIHSVTPDSPALTDPSLHERLADLAATGVTVGFSTSGPDQAAAIRAALEIPVFRSVQATWNVLEPSAGAALTEAHAAGLRVIVKEGMANGRLATVLSGFDAPADAVALAAILAQPWADVVLSGAATGAQLASNLRALDVPVDLERLAPLAEPPAAYWKTRSGLPWQ